MSVAPLTYGSVCSGIEAATVAWHPLGWRPAFFSEIDAFPRAVLAHHYPTVRCHGDFTTIEAGQYDPIELLVGGTPCQSFSIAGLRGGLCDDRGNLALEYLRLADRLRPQWLVWENVPGVLSSNEGRDFGAILGGLVELGYGFAYRVLDAQHFGVPQRRRRVFVVGYLGDWRPAAAVLFERHSLQGHSSPRREAGASIAGALAGISPGGGWRIGADEAAAGQLVANPLRAQAQPSHREDSDTYIPVAADLRNGSVSEVAMSLQSGGMGEDRGLCPNAIPHVLAFGGNNTRGPIDVACALNACGTASGRNACGTASGRMDFESETFVVGTLNANGKAAGSATQQDAESGMLVTHALTANGFDAGEDGAGRGTPLVPVCFNSREDPCVTGDVSGALGSSSPQSQAVAYQCHGSNVGEIGTLRSGGNVGGGVPFMQQHAGVRRLTPRECERLQGFPDDYTAVPYRGKIAADGPRYKALGNSMNTDIMAWIGRRIEMVRQVIGASAVAGE